MGAGIRGLTVLYDADCGICRTARRGLERRAQYVPLTFVAAGSETARRRYPGLDHNTTLADITVVADTGDEHGADVYSGDSAWLICLWALRQYRSLALRLAQPHLRPLARQMVNAAALVRQRKRYRPWIEPDGLWSEPEECVDGGCRSAGEGR